MSVNQPHHDGSALHVGSTTPALGERCTLRLRVPQDWGSASRVWVRSVQDAEPRYDEARILARPAVGRGGRPACSTSTPWRCTVLSLKWPAQKAAVPLLAPEQRRAAQQGHLRLQRLPRHHGHARPGVVARRRHVPGVPRPICPLRPGGWPAHTRIGAWPALGHPRAGRGPDVASQFYGGDLDGVTEKLDELRPSAPTLST